MANKTVTADLPPPAPTSPSERIHVRELVKTFTRRGSEVTAVDRLDLQIRTGEFFVIVGPSGCGKTTLLRMLAGLETPSGGVIDIAEPGGDLPAHSMIFQGDSIFPWMTVWDNAAYGLTMRRRPKAEIREIVGHYLDKTGLTRFARSYPHELSGGMRQRVSIARAFSNDPDILLMDEPFSALDEQNKTLLQDELLRIWDETKKTVVFITHSVDEAVTMGDRVMVMTSRPGRVKKIVDVPFERPREVLELRAQPEYGELIHEIWGSLRSEVLEAQEREQLASLRGRS
ncbi:ABC transporter ATP-binding protein [Pseudonocardia oroxyli]|uniref:NitT/TauT family transport system ATP-binding protein n=1 Tax=Pseudonocardia oroxyli TaxID=366584 RepID=A0A1G8D018_PSEOR|nr:ABC transporter ATP-binding protein [Pseudonocardia oroxyli]SDH50763.1 NitT/TauT family transport system ATP-binding protein [Pseudonocardia oroxyli]